MFFVAFVDGCCKVGSDKALRLGFVKSVHVPIERVPYELQFFLLADSLLVPYGTES